jgi:hypothetical protein
MESNLESPVPAFTLTTTPNKIYRNKQEHNKQTNKEILNIST